MKTDRLKWIVTNTCRLLVSATFVFSGLVKLIDPHGTEYKIQDYLVALGLGDILPHPGPIALAVALALMEFCLGIYLFFGIRRRWTTRTILAFMIVYVPLTLWLAVSNAVEDCGCFGDAVHLTNWQTFWKNVALLAAAVLLCRTRRYQTRVISESTQWIISLYSIVYGIILAMWCLYAEPVMDFRPFHIGQDVVAAMQWPDDVDATPEILDFTIEPIPDMDYSDNQAALVEQLSELDFPEYTFLLTAPYLNTADDGMMERINAVADYAAERGYAFVCLTASDAASVQRWCELTGADYAFAFMDELTLKTIARSNPALVLMHGSKIVGKWSNATMPKEEVWSGPLQSLPQANPQIESYRRMLVTLLLLYLLPLLLLTAIDRTVTFVRWRKANR